ncbi:dynamin family protein [Micromonospora sp. WMMD714]|uniref:dynamin family protein n=1 Tax=Micromonospora sp. WMMD714 TaxID=3016097 RepID=UPI00249CF3C7|nr:dynamin family protein [Micromonospora sp. WMMD714]WFE63556.1 dynamin family protein [Micromonospora sp. WMMD714]
MPSVPTGTTDAGTASPGVPRRPSPVSAELVRYAGLAAGAGAELAPLARLLDQADRRLAQPMRLAVVGQIKRGKSTLVNALLGEEVAATGQLELTFTVNELCHHDHPVVRVFYRDGAPAREMSPERLRELTVNDPRHLTHLRRIRRVELGLPNPLLRAFRLVDTPGLGSVHVTDSANTLDFLGLSNQDLEGSAAELTGTLDALDRTARDVHQDSSAELHRADAVLYLFRRGLHETDKAAIEQFLGGVDGPVTPLKSFGVLSRCDDLWPPTPGLPGNPDRLTFDPMAAGRTLAEGYLRRDDIRRLFYTVLPISGLVGMAARTLTDEHFTWLDELARVDLRRLARRVSDVGTFGRAETIEGSGVPAGHRRELLRVLGGWGIVQVCRYLHEDRLSPALVRDRLRVDSGVTTLTELITSHFGNRATLLKLSHGLNDVNREIARIRLAGQRTGEAVPAVVDDIAAGVERLRAETPMFAEFDALSAYYNGETALDPDEAAQLLRITGEHGLSCAARLGLPEQSSVQTIVDRAGSRVREWARREQDPSLDWPTGQAARVVLRAYERVEYRARQARRLLDGTDDLIEPTPGEHV